MSAALLLVLSQISAGAIVARVKEADLRVRDLSAHARLEIVTPAETLTRTFSLLLLREEVNYRAIIELIEPTAMKGTRFLVHAERGKRNSEWAYFPDLDLVRSIPGKSQDDGFLGSDITYADLAGGAHLDDLLHRLVGEESVDGEPCYVLEGVPRHRIAYGKLRGWVRKDDFVTVRAAFYDGEGALLKEAFLTDVRDLGGGIRLAHRIEVRSATEDRKSVLTFEEVTVNQGLPADAFTEDALGRE